MQRLRAERGRYLVLRDLLQLDRQGAKAQLGGELRGALGGEAAGDLAAAARRDPLRELLVVDLGDADQLVIERDREVLVVLLPRWAGE